MLVTRTSRISQTVSTMDLDVTQQQLDRIENRYSTGEHIQNIVPNLSGGEREFLITGITPKEWSEVFDLIEE